MHPWSKLTAAGLSMSSTIVSASLAAPEAVSRDHAHAVAAHNRKLNCTTHNRFVTFLSCPAATVGGVGTQRLGSLHAHAHEVHILQHALRRGPPALRHQQSEYLRRALGRRRGTLDLASAQLLHELVHCRHDGGPHLTRTHGCDSQSPLRPRVLRQLAAAIAIFTRARRRMTA